MRYSVRLSSRADREIGRLAPGTRKRVVAKVAELGGDPRPDGARKLAGMRDAYRVRVGAYRIIYEVRNQELLVLVIAVGHRERIYESL